MLPQRAWPIPRYDKADERSARDEPAAERLSVSEAGVLDRNPGQPAAEAIHIEDLHKKFGTLHVLKGVSLSARDGEVVAIIGGSGSGKSTLLRCINCLENPTSGIIRVNGEEIG